jgi:hypothetical protein
VTDSGQSRLVSSIGVRASWTNGSAYSSKARGPVASVAIRSVERASGASPVATRRTAPIGRATSRAAAPVEPNANGVRLQYGWLVNATARSGGRMRLPRTRRPSRSPSARITRAAARSFGLSTKIDATVMNSTGSRAKLTGVFDRRMSCGPASVSIRNANPR